MNKHESEVSTFLQNIVTKPVAINSIEIWMTTFKKAYRKSWTLGVWSGLSDSGHLGSGLLDSGRLDTWTLDDWTLDNWALGLWTARRLDSWLLDAWTLDAWTLELGTLGARKFFAALLTSVSILLLVNVEFLIISGTLRSMYYGSVECAANDCYNSILLLLILQLIL